MEMFLYKLVFFGKCLGLLVKRFIKKRKKFIVEIVGWY